MSLGARIGGQSCSAFHRCYTCPKRQEWRDGYAIPVGLFDAIVANPDLPLWTTGLTIDPTRSFPAPSLPRLEWTTIPPSGVCRFTGSCFGDGSAQEYFGSRTRRCGFSVVQLRRSPNGSGYVVHAAVVGPLPGPIQATPAAELMALVHFVLVISDGL